MRMFIGLDGHVKAELPKLDVLRQMLNEVTDGIQVAHQDYNDITDFDYVDYYSGDPYQTDMRNQMEQDVRDRLIRLESARKWLLEAISFTEDRLPKTEEKRRNG